MADSSASPCIRKLEEDVVNKIAAGEVIHRPSSALKEMLENSLDAGATQITIVAKQGGLKLLQIQDNGHGIRLEDMPIVCERFTTSKLRTFDDLQDIRTFGFRGEALASITHVAKVTITTMTDGAECAYKAAYLAGRIVNPDKKTPEPGKPRPCAGTRGTIIAVEDLFYNVQTRRKALKSASEEYQRIMEVVTRYAVNNPHCSMNCKKAEATTSDVHTPRASTSSRNIGLLFGQSVARELIPVACDRLQHPDLQYRLEGLVTGVNYNSRKAVFILFINGRLVDCSPLKKAIDVVYQDYLPKHTHPFVYISLFIQPSRLDVNVHPTKKEVHFLNETEIIADIHELLAHQLVGQNASRSFLAQTLLAPPATAATEEDAMHDEDDTAAPPASAQKRPKADQKKAEDECLRAPEMGPVKAPKAVKELAYKTVRTAEQRGAMERYVVPHPSATGTGDTENKTPVSGDSFSGMGAKRRKLRDNPNQLTSVSNLLMATEGGAHSLLSELFEKGAFVGNVNHRFSLVQFRTGLYILDMCAVTQELARQLVLLNFGRLKKISLVSKPKVVDLVQIALDMDGVWEPIHGDKAQIATKATVLLQTKAEMINEYFSIEIDASGHLCAVPQVLQDYIPPLSRLPLFLLRLATDVEWEYEQPCFDTLSRELADFCAFPDVLPSHASPPDMNLSQVAESQPMEGTQPTDGEQAASQGVPTASPDPSATQQRDVVLCGGTAQHLKWLLQHVVMPACRSFLVPPKTWATNGTVVQIACLENLYKVFERC